MIPALCIILGILALIALCLSLRIQVTLQTDGDSVVSLKIGPFRIPLTDNGKKSGLLSRFTHKKEKKTEKPKKKSAASAEKGEKSAENALSTLDTVRLILDLLPDAGRKLRTEVCRLHITVGGSDAAAVARLFGVISAAVGILLEILENHTDLKPLSPGDALVIPDFCAEKTTVSLCLKLKLRIGSVLSLLIRFFVAKAAAEAKKAASAAVTST